MECYVDCFITRSSCYFSRIFHSLSIWPSIWKSHRTIGHVASDLFFFLCHNYFFLISRWLSFRLVSNLSLRCRHWHSKWEIFVWANFEFKCVMHLHWSGALFFFFFFGFSFYFLKIQFRLSLWLNRCKRSGGHRRDVNLDIDVEGDETTSTTGAFPGRLVSMMSHISGRGGGMDGTFGLDCYKSAADDDKRWRTGCKCCFMLLGFESEGTCWTKTQFTLSLSGRVLYWTNESTLMNAIGIATNSDDRVWCWLNVSMHKMGAAVNKLCFWRHWSGESGWFLSSDFRHCPRKAESLFSFAFQVLHNFDGDQCFGNKSWKKLSLYDLLAAIP